MRNNVVLNDDTVVCIECWNELMSADYLCDSENDAIMGHSLEACKWCGYDPRIAASRSLSKSGRLTVQSI